MKKEAYYLISIIVALYAGVVVLFFFTPLATAFDFFVRLAVLLGFTSIFLAIVTTAFMKQLFRLFGKPFLKVHHIFSILGLVLITIHPVAIAIEAGDITVFLPSFASWQIFWELAGRPAFYILYVAAFAVLIRKKLSPKVWRAIHGLNYVALIFAYFHGTLIGTDFQNLGINILFTAMFVIAIEIFVYRRYQKYKLKQKRTNT